MDCLAAAIVSPAAVGVIDFPFVQRLTARLIS
jgi:hypothetical protein